MEIRTHFIISTIIAIILFPFYEWLVLLIILGGVLVDIDHYLDYVIRLKKYNIKRAMKYYRTIALEKDMHLYRKITRIFHTIEFLILIFILAFFSRYILLVGIGIYIHFLLDLLSETKIFKSITPRYSLFGILG